MLKAIISFTILIAFFTGCATLKSTDCTTTQKAYQISSVVTPFGVDGPYKVDIVVSEPGSDGSTILSSPSILVESGKESLYFSGSTSITKSGGEEIKDGVSCSVLVSKNDNATEAKVSVVLKENGKETLNTTQTTIVKQ